jgi:hypothetical protein
MYECMHTYTTTHTCTQSLTNQRLSGRFFKVLVRASIEFSQSLLAQLALREAHLVGGSPAECVCGEMGVKGIE